MKHLLIILILIFAATAVSFAAEPVKPLAGEKCPVCGMFVAKYSDFLAQIIYKDGSHAVFDGAKDMFHYYFNLSKYDASKKRENIESIYVTDYYNLAPIDAKKAFYVIGSNVTGPMGRELIPFQRKEDAEEFMADHAGKRRLLFDEVTFDLVKGLD